MGQRIQKGIQAPLNPPASLRGPGRLGLVSQAQPWLGSWLLAPSWLVHPERQGVSLSCIHVYLKSNNEAAAGTVAAEPLTCQLGRVRSSSSSGLFQGTSCERNQQGGGQGLIPFYGAD